jgi:hypothetical protein
MVSLGLASKLVALDFLVCVSKLAATVLWFGPQNHRDDFLIYVSKSSSYDLSVAPQNRRKDEVELGFFSLTLRLTDV